MENRGCPSCSDQDVRLLYEVDGLKAFRCHACGHTFNIEAAPESGTESPLTDQDRDAIVSHSERMLEQGRRLRKIADELYEDSEDLRSTIEQPKVKVKHR